VMCSGALHRQVEGDEIIIVKVGGTKPHGDARPSEFQFQNRT